MRVPDHRGDDGLWLALLLRAPLRYASRVRALLAAIAIASPLLACGRELPAGGKVNAPIAGARMTGKAEPGDVLPADLDLVLRIDMKRLRAGLGAAFMDDLGRATARATGDDDAATRAALCGEVVWVGLRVADLDAGDRVVVVEGRSCFPTLASGDWRESAQRVLGETVAVFDRKAGAPRAGTDRIVRFGERMVELVSPAEVDSVGRVLRDGPDDKRADPAAEGVVSLDLRGRGLPPRLARKFPSIASVVAGIERVRATGNVADDGVHVEAQIVCPSRQAADKVQRFLDALRENAADSKAKDVLGKLFVETVETTVRVRWTLPASAIRGAIAEPAPEPIPTPAPASSAPPPPSK